MVELSSLTANCFVIKALRLVNKASKRFMWELLGIELKITGIPAMVRFIPANESWIRPSFESTTPVECLSCCMTTSVSLSCCMTSSRVTVVDDDEPWEAEKFWPPSGVPGATDNRCTQKNFISKFNKKWDEISTSYDSSTFQDIL